MAGPKVTPRAQQSGSSRGPVWGGMLFVDGDAGDGSVGSSSARPRRGCAGLLLHVLGRRRIWSHAVYLGARGRMRGQRVGMRVAVAEGRVVGGSHPHRGVAQMMPMSGVLLREQSRRRARRGKRAGGEI
jgi:hypothetical protein